MLAEFRRHLAIFGPNRGTNGPLRAELAETLGFRSRRSAFGATCRQCVRNSRAHSDLAGVAGGDFRRRTARDYSASVAVPCYFCKSRPLQGRRRCTAGSPIEGRLSLCLSLVVLCITHHSQPRHLRCISKPKNRARPPTKQIVRAPRSRSEARRHTHGPQRRPWRSLAGRRCEMRAKGQSIG